MFDRQIPPRQLSPSAWQLGYRDHQLVIRIHEMGCTDDGYEDLQVERQQMFDKLAEMSAEELRAYIDGLHSSMGEYFW